MGVFSSFLSVVQENAAISAELLGRAGGSRGDWRPGTVCPARSLTASGATDPVAAWVQQVGGSLPEQGWFLGTHPLARSG